MHINCIFCKIVAGEISSHKIYEDERCLAFLDIHPIQPGHTLVIPKAHHALLAETPDETLAHLAVTAKRVAAAVLRATGADGFNFSTNNGASAGQDVFHTHFHIIPRKSGDRLPLWPHREYAPGEIEETARIIRENISE